MSKQTEALKLAQRSIRELVIDESDDAPALQGVRMRKLAAEKSIREALAEQQAQQEPVATLWQHGETGRARITMPGDITDCDARWFKAADLYTSPPAQRKPLTDAQINAFFEGMEPNNGFWLSFARAIEAAHGIGKKK